MEGEEGEALTKQFCEAYNAKADAETALAQKEFGEEMSASSDEASASSDERWERRSAGLAKWRAAEAARELVRAVASPAGAISRAGGLPVRGTEVWPRSRQFSLSLSRAVPLPERPCDRQLALRLLQRLRVVRASADAGRAHCIVSHASLALSHSRCTGTRALLLGPDRVRFMASATTSTSIHTSHRNARLLCWG